MAGTAGIGPTSTVLETASLPLNYAPMKNILAAFVHSVSTLQTLIGAGTHTYFRFDPKAAVIYDMVESLESNKDFSAANRRVLTVKLTPQR